MTIKGSLAVLCVELLIAPIPRVLAQHQTPPTQQMPEGAPQGPPQPMLTPDHWTVWSLLSLCTPTRF
jgi:hypothetical protein